MKNKLNSILLIDDDMTVNFIHRHIIETAKVTDSLSIAETAESALKLLSQKKPDLILLDLNMPKTNGWEFLVQYKKKILPANRSRIVILSSSANPDDKHRAEKSPEVSGFYNKPLTKDALIEIFNETRKSISNK